MPSRRAVLTAALAAGALGACTPDEQTPPAVAPDPDPDLALATEALAAETAIVALVDSLTRLRPRRVRALADSLAVHEAHVRLLSEAAPTQALPSPSPSPTFGGDDRAAYLALARAEVSLAQTLRSAAARAESGPFARVLASMAAAAAQQNAAVRALR